MPGSSSFQSCKWERMPQGFPTLTDTQRSRENALHKRRWQYPARDRAYHLERLVVVTAQQVGGPRENLGLPKPRCAPEARVRGSAMRQASSLDPPRLSALGLRRPQDS
jgi:hypothetical protein